MLLQFFAALQSGAPVSLEAKFQITNLVWKEDRVRVIGTRGGGEFIIAVISRFKEVDANPAAGVDYTAGSYGTGDEIGDGNFVGYKGTAADFEIFGLERDVPYGLKIYEARTVSGQLVYNG